MKSEAMRLKKLLSAIVFMIVIFGCNKVLETPKSGAKPSARDYFDEKLSQKIKGENFEEDSKHGFIKIGNFLDPNIRNAVVVRIDSIRDETSEISVYELRNAKWTEIFHQKGDGFARVYPIEPFIADYNFDGKNDLGFRHEISNGAAIMTFHVWLSDGKTFRHVKEFSEIGNPTLFTKQKMVRGFEACCSMAEISLTDYRWNGFQLEKIKTLNIADYPYGKKATLKDESKNTETQIRISSKEINRIVAKYGTNWQLVDSGTEAFPK